MVAPMPAIIVLGVALQLLGLWMYSSGSRSRRLLEAAALPIRRGELERARAMMDEADLIRRPWRRFKRSA
jgi:hypothetical protein